MTHVRCPYWNLHVYLIHHRRKQMLTLNVKWLTMFEHMVQFVLDIHIFSVILRSKPNHAPLQHKCSCNMSNQSRCAYFIGRVKPLSTHNFLRCQSSDMATPTMIGWTIGDNNKHDTFENRNIHPIASCRRAPSTYITFWLISSCMWDASFFLNLCVIKILLLMIILFQKPYIYIYIYFIVMV